MQRYFYHLIVAEIEIHALCLFTLENFSKEHIS